MTRAPRSAANPKPNGAHGPRPRRVSRDATARLTTRLVTEQADCEWSAARRWGACMIPTCMIALGCGPAQGSSIGRTVGRGPGPWGCVRAYHVHRRCGGTIIVQQWTGRRFWARSKRQARDHPIGAALSCDLGRPTGVFTRADRTGWCLLYSSTVVPDTSLACFSIHFASVLLPMP